MSTNNDIDWEDVARIVADGRMFKRSDRFHRVALYIVDRDAHQREVKDWKDWIDRAALVLRDTCLGVTAFPAGFGKWYNPETRETVSDSTVVLYAFIFDIKHFKENVMKLRDFVQGYGEHAKQGAIFIELGDNVYELKFPENQRPPEIPVPT